MSSIYGYHPTSQENSRSVKLMPCHHTITQVTFLSIRQFTKHPPCPTCGTQVESYRTLPLPKVNPPTPRRGKNPHLNAQEQNVRDRINTLHQVNRIQNLENEANRLQQREREKQQRESQIQSMQRELSRLEAASREHVEDHEDDYGSDHGSDEEERVRSERIQKLKNKLRELGIDPVQEDRGW